MDVNEISNNIEVFDESVGVDLNAYGAASPTKIIIEAIKYATQIMQTSAKVSLNEHNPLTATTLKSKLGLAYLANLNPAKLLVMSSGYIRVDTKGLSVAIKQYSKLRSIDNIDYYVVLQNDVVMIDKPTEFLVCQGIRQSISVEATNERWQTIDLISGGIVPHKSINAYYEGKDLKLAFDIHEKADAYLAISDAGAMQIIVHPDFYRIPGKSFVIDYTDSVGAYGDNTTVGSVLKSGQFAFIGDKDVTNDIDITIATPIIGGTDFENFSEDLSYELMLGSRNNLIGNADQVLHYVKKFKQYVIQQSTITVGVLSLSVLRNISTLMKATDYWHAIQNVQIDDNDVKSLMLHLNTLANKSTELLINIEPAEIEQCEVVIVAKMPKTDHASVVTVLIDYIISELYSRNYEQATLYHALIKNTAITEMSCRFIGNVNEFGTAIPTNDRAILVVNKATITINKQTIVYE